jgi:hypothetical protein
MILRSAITTGMRAVFLALVAIPSAADAQSVFDGRGNGTSVPLPRIETPVQVDGALNERVWERAAVLTGFSQYRPVDGRAADDSTRVLVYYAPDAIYFGIRAYEGHGSVVRATLADRDNIGADDRIHILLDTYNDNRRALLFAVNPLGVQQDGVQSEGFDPSQSAGGRFDGVVDISPDFLYESRGRVTDWGYEIEVRIPFKSLRYQSADPQTWGLQVVRFTQHSGYEDTWTPAVRANASFLIQSGRITGLTGLRHGLVMDINPEFTSSLDGTPRGDDWKYGKPENELGGNLRWGINPNATLNATINPDFSQVESDVGQVTVNERFALFFPEKRPFFLEALEQYDTPNRLIYTRQIRDPLAGAKLTAKFGGTAIAYLGAADDRQFSRTGDDVPVFNLLRVRRDLGATSTLGIVHTDRIEGSDYNRVTGADARLVWRKIWFSTAQIAGSWTGVGGDARTGTLWNVVFADRTGRSYGNHYELKGVTRDFEAASGFIPRTGVIDGSAFNRFSFYGRPGSRLEQLSIFSGVTPLWRYEDFPNGGTFESQIVSSWVANLRGGWSAIANFSNSSQRFDEAVYLGNQIIRPADTVAMTLPKSLYNLWGGSVGFGSPNRALSYSVNAGHGQAVIFAEGAEGRQSFIQGSVSWRPTAVARIEGSMVYQRLKRARDGSEFSTASIPRLKVEYQLSRAIFVRYVGQYFSQDRAALVDPRGGLPLILSPTGSAFFGSSAAAITNDFRNDLLFSYKPTTGTVFFVGYGASMTEPRAFSFERATLNRVSDGFFLKASYTYRL